MTLPLVTCIKGELQPIVGENSDYIASYCGRWGWYNRETKTVSPFYCNSLKCPRERCRKVAYIRRVQQVQSAVDTHSLTRFFTLTLDRSKVSEDVNPWRYISECWNKMRTVLKRKYPGFTYIAVLEAHKETKWPHIHGFCNTYIHVTDWSSHWSNCGGGKIVWVEKVKDGGASEYIGKQLKVVRYIGKDNLSNAYISKPYRGRTIWKSRCIANSVPEKSVDKSGHWCILKETVFDKEGNLIRSITSGENERERENVERTFTFISEESFGTGIPHLETKETERERSKEGKRVTEEETRDKRGYSQDEREIDYG